MGTGGPVEEDTHRCRETDMHTSPHSMRTPTPGFLGGLNAPPSPLALVLVHSFSQCPGEIPWIRGRDPLLLRLPGHIPAWRESGWKGTTCRAPVPPLQRREHPKKELSPS